MALDRYSINWPRVDSCFPITPAITDSIRYRYRYIGTYTPLLEVKNQNPDLVEGLEIEANTITFQLKKTSIDLNQFHKIRGPGVTTENAQNLNFVHPEQNGLG